MTFPPDRAGWLDLWQAQSRDYAVLVLDPQGIVVEALGSVEATLGYAPAELVGGTLALLLTEEDCALGIDRSEVETARASGHAMDDRWHVRKDGAHIWVGGTLTALHGADGALLGFVKLMRDRTDLRTQIAALEQRVQSLALADERKYVFLATLGHELRNPLAPLANAAELLRMAGRDERLALPLQVIERQLAVMKRLVDDLLDVARIDAGKLDLRFEELRLQQALTQAVELCRPAARAHRLALLALLPEPPITIEADAVRFEQMVVNLVNNAIKYTPPGGQIWVKATVESAQAVIRVEDDGVGIEPEMQARIFELFAQEASARAQAGGGLGIGLALVKNLVELHHGNVEVKSSGRDKGSQFTLRLPLRQPGPP
jgi:two-component system CheB/CheR fusion protein